MPKKRTLALLIICALLAVVLCCAGSRRIFRKEDQKFEAFANELFRQEVSANAITLHYTLRDPAACGIETAAPSLGSYPVSGEETAAAAENILTRLHSISCQELSGRNQFTWRLLEESFTQALAGSGYLLLAEPLCPLTGVQAQLPVLLSEYRLRSVTDVENYLALLGALPEHFDSLIAFEKQKAKAGLFMSSDAAAAIIRECRSFVNSGSENYLYPTFEDRIGSLSGLDDTQKQQYIEQNGTALRESVFPAFRKLAGALSALKGTGNNTGGLCHFQNGASYYKYLIRTEAGSDRSPEELQELIEAQILADLTAMQQVMGAASLPEYSLEDPEPAAILAELKTHLKKNFPAIPETAASVKYVRPELSDYLSPAFYLVPAIDSGGSQTIYINSGRLPDDLELFSTLAHEGYPGHLYQHVYFNSTDPAPIRSLLDWGGYTEGWATYAEMLSYYFTGLPKAQASLLQHNADLLLGLYALADLGIHYEGWALTDTAAFFREYGIEDTDAVSEIYSLITADPANYLKYYIGYLEFLELKKEAIRKWGDDFTQKRFHRAVLDAGPAPFFLLREYIFESGD